MLNCCLEDKPPSMFRQGEVALDLLIDKLICDRVFLASMLLFSLIIWEVHLLFYFWFIVAIDFAIYFILIFLVKISLILHPQLFFSSTYGTHKWWLQSNSFIIISIDVNCKHV